MANGRITIGRNPLSGEPNAGQHVESHPHTMQTSYGFRYYGGGVPAQASKSGPKESAYTPAQRKAQVHPKFRASMWPKEFGTGKGA
jgi:hypothetical protein